MDGNACKKRLDDFRRAMDSAKSRHLRNFYAYAINVTEESLWILSELLEIGHEKMDEDNRLINDRIERQNQTLRDLDRKLNEAKLDLETKTDDLSRSLAILKIKMIQTRLDLDVSAENTELFGIQSSIRLGVVPALGKSLFDDILTPDEESFSVEAAVDGIHFAVGLIPFLGNIYSGLLAIHGIAARRDTLQRNADSHLAYLEEYCYALKIWGEAAQSAIRALQPLDEH